MRGRACTPSSILTPYHHEGHVYANHHSQLPCAQKSDFLSTVGMSLRGILQDKYNSEPAVGKKNNDLILTAGQIWKL